MEVNPDHYKYMPRGADETPADLPAEETVEITEEALQETTEEKRQESEKTTSEEPRSASASPLHKEQEPASDETVEEEIPYIRESVLVSVIYNFFSPLLVPTYATIFIFLLSLLIVVAPAAVIPYGLTVFGATCLLPALLILVLRKIGVIESVQLYDRNDRIVPYVIEFLAMGAMAIFFVVKGAMPWIWTIFCAGAAIALVNFAINFRMRISNHCSAMAALLAVLIVIQTYGVPPLPLRWWALGTALFCGIIGTLAILKGRHTIWEVLAGYATGFLGIILFSLIH